MVGSPCSPRDSQESSPVPQFKGINSLALSLFYCPALISIPEYWKKHNFDYTHLCQQSMSLLFNTWSRFAIAFLPRSNHPLISWLQSPSAVILEPKKMKSVTVWSFPHLFAMKWWDRMAWSEYFEYWVLVTGYSKMKLTKEWETLRIQGPLGSSHLPSQDRQHNFQGSEQNENAGPPGSKVTKNFKMVTVKYHKSPT